MKIPKDKEFLASSRAGKSPNRLLLICRPEVGTIGRRSLTGCVEDTMERKMKIVALSGLLFVSLALAFAGCGENDGSPANDDASNDADVVAPGIMLSGVLIAGEQPSAAPRRALSATLPEAGDPLAGYQLYCVTLATPVAAASGTADAEGRVELELDAEGVAVGCFVLDADDEAVATLIFTSGDDRGQTVVFNGDTELGSITVDLGNGVAQVGAGTNGALTDSEGLACPLGTWVTDVPRKDCTGTATVTVWFARQEDGSYTVSYTIGLVQLATTGKCGYHSDAGLPVAQNEGAFSFSTLNDPTCESIFRDLVVTPNEGCTQLTVDSTIEGCVSCTDGCGCGGGSETCTQSFTLTRE